MRRKITVLVTVIMVTLLMSSLVGCSLGIGPGTNNIKSTAAETTDIEVETPNATVPEQEEEGFSEEKSEPIETSNLMLKFVDSESQEFIRLEKEDKFEVPEVKLWDDEKEEFLKETTNINLHLYYWNWKIWAKDTIENLNLEERIQKTAEEIDLEEEDLQIEDDLTSKTGVYLLRYSYKEQTLNYKAYVHNKTTEKTSVIKKTGEKISKILKNSTQK